MEAGTADIHHELIDRCRQRDKEACYRVYKLYARNMYNAAYRIVNDAMEAEDVLQEAFISAFQNLEQYRGESSFGAWLKRIVINKAINALKKRKWERLPEGEEGDVVEEPEGEEVFPFSVIQVRDAIEKLPDGYRAVLSMYLLEGFDHIEIAQVLNISESTSKSQFNRSKKKLREILKSRKA